MKLPLLLRALSTGILLPSFFAINVSAADMNRPGNSGYSDRFYKPNILFIVIDDLNDWVGVLGGHPQANTPHIDQLADRGVLFTNAQAPVCNPSRTSFMLGLRPSTTGIYSQNAWFRNTPSIRNSVTLPQYFKRHGYKTLTTGKIFHLSQVDWPSFEIVGPRPGQRLKIDRRIIEGSKGNWDFGAQTYPEKKFGDFAVASWAINRLQEKHEKPFFLAVGFYRPHVPFYAPERFFDIHPREEVLLPVVRDDDRDDLSEAAVRLTDTPKSPPHKWFVERGLWKDAVQAYLASTSFTDGQVGRLLDALSASRYADNTIIVLLSDHGFHLGEKQRWAKHSLWERSTRVPLIISTPSGLQGKQSVNRPGFTGDSNS